MAGRLPPGFDGWFARCVTRSLPERFPTAREAWDALEPLLAPTLAATVPSAPAAALFAAAGEGPPLPAEATAPMPSSTTSAPTLKAARAAPTRARTALLAGAAVAVVAVAGLVLSLRGSGSSAPASTASTTAGPAPSTVPSPSPSPVPKERISFEPATFTMGNDAKPGEKPAHRAFALDRTEVTVAAYRACVEAKRCTPPRAVDDACNARKTGHDEHPADCVDQRQAAEFCAWKGMRLPSEEEWEYAARGADARPYPWKGGPPTAARACFEQTAGTCPVGTHPEGDTPEGIADMAGNVWEWTSSPFCPYSAPQCGSKAFVIRGGSASSKAEMIAATVRFEAGSDDHYPGLGFRCAGRPDDKPMP